MDSGVQGTRVTIRATTRRVTMKLIYYKAYDQADYKGYYQAYDKGY